MRDHVWPAQPNILLSGPLLGNAADPRSTPQKLTSDKLIGAETVLGLTIEAFEAMPGSVREGSHGAVAALFDQPHRFCPQ